jgi:internalin A
MTPEEAYEEALRRIRKAEETRAVLLDLSGKTETSEFSGLEALNRLPPELEHLASLLSLNLSWCKDLTDISLLSRLTSLRSLDLSYCDQLRGDLTSLGRLTSLQSLNLWGCSLTGDLAPLAALTSLQSLNLGVCMRLSGNLSPLTGLTSLQSLHLKYCEQLSDLSPLAGLTLLQWLGLSYCHGVHTFAPLQSLMPTLKELYLFDCDLDDLPPEVCGEHQFENVLDKVRAHYEDLKSGHRIDAEVKVFFLGNGGVGKTQLCRRLRGMEFDPSIPTTHGIRLGGMALRLDRFPEPVRLNLWDFGGQDIYYGSHALFLHGKASFLFSGRLNSNTKRPITKAHSLSFTGHFPTGSITSAPLPGQILPY